MGEENKARSELFESKTLIDFLYIDNERIDSLISQLNHGTLRSVVKTWAIAEKIAEKKNPVTLEFISVSGFLSTHALRSKYAFHTGLGY